MTTSPKQFHKDFWYHVYARSLEEVPLFVTDAEREWFIEKLDDIFTRRRVSVGALCLMDTHYHALVKMGPVSLDRALNGLHMSYARHINNERGRRGTLFEKHPGTDIILDDSYLLQVVPYIHNNPLEAGIVENPREYEWHTDEQYRTGKWIHGPLDCWEWPPPFQVDDVHRLYKECMEETPEDLNRSEGYIGTESEWDALEKRKESRADRHRDRRDRRSMRDIALELAKENDTTVEKLKEPGREQPEAEIRQRAMALMYEEGYGPKEIGNFFKRSKGTVAHAVKKFQS